jgi:hypothetical protein
LLLLPCFSFSLQFLCDFSLNPDLTSRQSHRRQGDITPGPEEIVVEELPVQGDHHQGDEELEVESLVRAEGDQIRSSDSISVKGRVVILLLFHLVGTNLKRLIF